MGDIKGAAKGEFTRAKDRLLKTLAATPDDKINWTPSDKSRTPLQIGTHCALSIPGIQGWLSGSPFPYASMAEADAAWRKMEKEHTDRAQVVEMIEKGGADYLAWIDSLPEEKLGDMFQSPMGPVPIGIAITFSADHLRSHAAQIEYIQTMYGDYDMHM